uniref:Uncharacterized protein n=1 Tax=Ditylum brightwellii TaxID=49249 RepID=A0A7S4SAY7_9STRA
MLPIEIRPLLCKCCNPNDPSFNPSLNPSVAPSLSHETTNVTYNFCIQYGILGLKKVLTNTESVINTTLNGLFQNEANPVMTNCKVSDVQSVFNKTLECVCKEGDGISACSAVESTVMVSHDTDISGDEIQYVLLHYATTITKGLKYPAEYLGLVKLQTYCEITLDGVLPGCMNASSTSVFENTVKEYMNDFFKFKINGMKVLNVQVARNVTNPAADVKRENGDVINRNNDTRYLQSSLGDTTVNISIVGEYISPPYVSDLEFDQIVSNFIVENSTKLVQRLRQSNNSYFDSLKVVRAPTATPTATPTTDPEGGYKIGSLYASAPTTSPTSAPRTDPEGGYEIGSLYAYIFGFFMALSCCCGLFPNTQICKQKVKHIIESHFTNPVAATMVPRADSFSTITDPTYRGNRASRRPLRAAQRLFSGLDSVQDNNFLSENSVELPSIESVPNSRDNSESARSLWARFPTLQKCDEWDEKRISDHGDDTRQWMWACDRSLWSSGRSLWSHVWSSERTLRS